MKSYKEISKNVHLLLDSREFQKAYDYLNSEFNTFTNSESTEYSILTEICGGYISLGREWVSREATEKGLSILENRKGDLLKAATQASLDYYLGNAKAALYRVYLTENPQSGPPTPEQSKQHLFEEKSAYLRAYKALNLKKLDTFSSAVLTNLGGALNHSGRIVEALQCFDSVLRTNPRHPQSLVSKAEALTFMIRVTKCPKSISLFTTIYTLYDEGSKVGPVPPDVEETIVRGKQRMLITLTHIGVDLNNLSIEYQENKKEFKLHSPELRFNLTNFLSLSEHGLFCGCNGARKDDLALPFGDYQTSDVKFIRLESLLNRLKSEFSMARRLYYESTKRGKADNIVYHDLVDGAVNGLQFEKLRTSFRMCFGMLDKIAQGIIYLFDFEKGEKENIYFHAFWETNCNRWKQINEKKNIHLTALYSIASDLSRKDGEFHFYKDWRNKLEHELLTLTSENIDKFKIRSEKLFERQTDKDEFKEKTLHLLQLTRAAIFSYVFCVRQELLEKE